MDGLEVFAAVAFAIIAGEMVASKIRERSHRRTLADMAAHHRAQLSEVAAATKAQREEFATLVTRMGGQKPGLTVKEVPPADRQR